MKTAGAVRLLKAMDQSTAQRLLTHLSRDHYSLIQRLLVYPPDSAGRLMDPVSFLLPDSVHVSDAKKRVEQGAGLVGCEIYVIDDDFRLAGLVELNTLMTKKSRTLVKDIMKRHSQVVPVRAGITTLPAYKAWKTFRTLPVVESDNTVVGVLRYQDMVNALASENTNPVNADTSEDVIAVAGLFWNALTDMLDTTLSFRTRARKSE
jgi:magnesium transporter